MSVSYLKWPFFNDSHRVLSSELEVWCAENLSNFIYADENEACKVLVKMLGKAGWLKYCVPSGPGGEWGGIFENLDSRSLCLLREILGRYSALADFAFAMQGLGSGAISLAASKELKDKYLPKVSRGELIAAFALSEPDAGSDVAALSCQAIKSGDDYVIDGYKTWISNGGIADFYTVFARTGEGLGAKGISAFVVDANTPGLYIEEQIKTMSPHPLATLRFDGCRIPASQMIGNLHGGFKLAMMTLDIFRSSVAAAANGFARRALAEALNYACQRTMFNQKLVDFQLTQSFIGDMATAIDTNALLIYRTAWQRDVLLEKTTSETAMAKMTATESAQWVIDRAVQMLGGRGVVSEQPVERLYRDIRALRIYEGATEVQKLIIAREVVKQHSELKN